MYGKEEEEKDWDRLKKLDYQIKSMKDHIEKQKKKSGRVIEMMAEMEI